VFTTFLNQSLVNAVHTSNALFKNYWIVEYIPKKIESKGFQIKGKLIYSSLGYCLESL
jgi:hypothetical protein